ncbi:RNA polymerase sigma-70 factor [Pedobacter sp. LMG 31464]|uniref:RNA polymerase sigma-70 factor n=1 Tax=Pedobacter planticolens TaxID=2679964 RepID=A0A923DVS2_9SPHI|nr:RNA polymerase sigma-70 factor [Pedobacter planticolens]MBB2144861.1 RNA polymerase sigma-70 factor [Pedobacter planticolens]
MQSYNTFSDDKLLDLLKSGDEAAFNEIYKRNWAYLYDSACRVLGDQDAAKDILQEIFVWFWNHREQINTKTIQGYLYVAVKYKVANYIRNGKVKESFYTRVKAANIGAVFNDTSIEVNELIKFINEFTNDLSPRCKEVFQLSRFENLSHKEIAIKLGISEKTIENQITLALNKLRKKLSKASILMIFFI